MEHLFKVSQECNQCGLCAHNCPCKALAPTILKFSVLKKGFNVKKIIETAKTEHRKTENKYDKNYLWQGAIDYLKNDD